MARHPGKLAAEISRLAGKMRPLLPDIDPHDLSLILWSVLRGPKGRQFFVRKIKETAYGF